MMEDWCKRTAANLSGQSLGAIALEESAVINNGNLPVVSDPIEHLVIINGSPQTHLCYI